MAKPSRLAKLLVGVALTLSQWVAHADVLLGHVVAVSDGDTITVLDDSQQRHVIRLMGIDAPEKAQAFGQKAKQSLSDLVNDRDVSVTWFKKDRYGRTVGQVYVGDTDVCLEQINRGFAWHYKEYEREQSVEDRSRYADAEEQARIARIGLWTDEHPIEPSKFRRIK
ncbi:MAG: thermonuclease family protein [Limnohabitans sp.]